MPCNDLKCVGFPHFKVKSFFSGQLIPISIAIAHNPIIVSDAKVIPMEIIGSSAFIGTAENNTGILCVVLCQRDVGLDNIIAPCIVSRHCFDVAI